MCIILFLLLKNQPQIRQGGLKERYSAPGHPFTECQAQRPQREEKPKAFSLLHQQTKHVVKHGSLALLWIRVRHTLRLYAWPN